MTGRCGSGLTPTQPRHVSQVRQVAEFNQLELALLVGTITCWPKGTMAILTSL